MPAHALGTNQSLFRHRIGKEHSFCHAVAYVGKSHPDKKLVNTSASFMTKGGITLALLGRISGRFFLKMRYL